MHSQISLSTFGVLVFISTTHCYGQLGSITGSLLRDVVARIGGPEESLATSYDEFGAPTPMKAQQKVKHTGNFETRRDTILGPSIRDKEYLQHSPLTGHQSIQGGSGEGYQRLRPDGSMKNVEVLKTDSLPSFCDAPNPCPLGYKAEDGCLEEFENTAAFSREYEAGQDCMCDTEHMFNCPGATRESDARNFDNEAELTLDSLFQDLEATNPFLEGEKLPVVAKKTPTSPRM